MKISTVSPHPPGISPWMKPHEAAEYAGVGIRTIRDWQKQGLPYIKASKKIVRIHRDTLDEFLLNHTVNNNIVDDAVSSVMKDLKKGKNHGRPHQGKAKRQR